MRNELFQVQIIIDRQPLLEDQLDDYVEWKRAVISGQPGKQYGIYISLNPTIHISSECTFRYEIQVNSQTLRKGVFIKNRNHYIEGMRTGATLHPFKFNDYLIPGNILIKFWKCRIVESMIPTKQQLHSMEKKMSEMGSNILGESVNRTLPKYYDHIDLDSACLVFEYGYRFENLITRKRQIEDTRSDKRVKL
ncbi:hypothetical protein HDV06_001549 [Boothiomyces sp. JEL0866]|nr:hypothetical protein HDV06_001549 [Boothiomyces sp. JEL0866]